MSENKEQIYILDARSLPVRIALIILLLIAILFGWFSVRWQIGNLLAEVTSPNAENAGNSAETAYNFSPTDPLANWLSASIQKESDPNYVEGFENVVRLSPNDFRWWIQLGRAYEQADKPVKAEKAFLRAIEIAPNYTFPRWQIGNFYLRQNKPEKAFAELKKAAETNAIYREQVLSIAWDYYDQDTAKLEEIVGKSPDVRAGLAKFYAAKERPNKSLEIWNSLSDVEKERNKPVAKLIAQALYDKRYLLTAVEFVNQLKIENDAKAESVQNSDFESEIDNSNPVYFGWKVTPIEKLRVRLSPIKKYKGKRSLQIAFIGFEKTEINNIYQTIAVKPDTKYELSFWLKTENLKSAGTPKLEVLNVNNSQILASTEPFKNGSTDSWKQIKINFKVPNDTEGILLRTAREYCGDKCPIFGTIWYDNFNLKRISN